MERVVLHVDLDQFVVAVELLRRPELRGRPVLVGGTGDPTRRGVVMGASYEARAFGARSGTPLRTAAARCPEGIFLPVDREAYLVASEAVMSALHEQADTLEVAGWDEAFLLVETADAVRAARSVQTAVRQRTRLDCSVGIGDNKLRAKLASGFAKPAGVFRLDRASWREVMAERPADALWGIGHKTAARLGELGVRTVGELAEADVGELAAAFGPRTGPWLAALASGADDNPVCAEPPRPRSRGREVTFQQDVVDPEQLREQVRALARTVAEDLHREGDRTRRVVVKVRFVPFDTRTHGASLDAPTRSAENIEQAALRALAAFESERAVRLVGVRAEVLLNS